MGSLCFVENEPYCESLCKFGDATVLTNEGRIFGFLGNHLGRDMTSTKNG